MNIFNFKKMFDLIYIFMFFENVKTAKQFDSEENESEKNQKDCTKSEFNSVILKRCLREYKEFGAIENTQKDIRTTENFSKSKIGIDYRINDTKEEQKEADVPEPETLVEKKLRECDIYDSFGNLTSRRVNLNEEKAESQCRKQSLDFTATFSDEIHESKSLQCIKRQFEAYKLSGVNQPKIPTNKTEDSLDSRLDTRKESEISSERKESRKYMKDEILLTTGKEKHISQDNEKNKLQKKDKIELEKSKQSKNDLRNVLGGKTIEKKENSENLGLPIQCLNKDRYYPGRSDSSKKDRDIDELNHVLDIEKRIKKETEEALKFKKATTFNPGTETSMTKTELNITEVSKANERSLTSTKKSTPVTSLSNFENDEGVSLVEQKTGHLGRLTEKIEKYRSKSTCESEKNAPDPYYESEIKCKSIIESKSSNNNFENFESSIHTKKADISNEKDQIENNRFDQIRIQQQPSEKTSTSYAQDEKPSRISEQKREGFSFKAIDPKKKREGFLLDDPRCLHGTYRDWLRERYGDKYTRKNTKPVFPQLNYQISGVSDNKKRGFYTESTTELEVVEKNTELRRIESSVTLCTNENIGLVNRTNQDDRHSIFETDPFFRNSRERFNKIKNHTQEHLAGDIKYISKNPDIKVETIENEIHRILEKYNLIPKQNQQDLSLIGNEQGEINPNDDSKKYNSEILQQQKSKPVSITVKEDFIKLERPILIVEKQEENEGERKQDEDNIQISKGQEIPYNTEPSGLNCTKHDELIETELVSKRDKASLGFSSIRRVCKDRLSLTETTKYDNKNDFCSKAKAVSSPDLTKNKIKVKEKNDKKKKNCLIS